MDSTIIVAAWQDIPDPGLMPPAIQAEEEEEITR